MAQAAFRGTPTYLAVFKMMISSKNVNQNVLKIPSFLEKIYKNSLSTGGRLQIPVGLRRLGPLFSDPLPHAILPISTLLLQKVLSLSPFLMKVLRRKF